MKAIVFVFFACIYIPATAQVIQQWRSPVQTTYDFDKKSYSIRSDSTLEVKITNSRIILITHRQDTISLNAIMYQIDKDNYVGNTSDYTFQLTPEFLAITTETRRWQIHKK
jgi:hypothetical protein